MTPSAAGDVGYGHRVHGCMDWQRRLKITDASFGLMVDKCLQSYSSQLATVRRKFTKDALEDASIQSAILLHLLDELKEEFPINDCLLKGVQDQWVMGDAGMDLALQDAYHDKSKNFKPTDLPFLQDIVKKTTQLQVAGGQQSSPSCGLTAAKLEDEQYEIFMRSCNYDLQVHNIYIKQLTDQATNTFFKRAQWRRSRYIKCSDVAPPS